MSILQKIKSTFFTVRYLKFAVTGITAFVIDFTIFSYLIKSGRHELFANSISIPVSIVVNYLVNRFWVWDSKEKQVAMEFGKFLSVQGVNFVLNNLFLLLFIWINISNIVLTITDFISPTITELIGFIEGEDGNKLLAKFTATGIQMITSFLFYKFFVFKKK